MSRLSIRTKSQAEAVVEDLYHSVERRIASSPPGLCPVDMTLTFLNLCHAQSCGKCVPCRVGLGQLSTLLRQVLDGTGTLETIDTIETTARVIHDTADCAIGVDAAQQVLLGLQGFRDDYISHVTEGRCLGGLENPGALRGTVSRRRGHPRLRGPGLRGAVRRRGQAHPQGQPLPHRLRLHLRASCEARCRRGMIDNPINIRGLKKFAVNNAGFVPNPPCAPDTGKRVAIVGGGPGGLSAAYYLRLMGHQVTVYEKQKKLGGMLRYGIPSYRFPREKLDGEIASILSTGIEVKLETEIGTDITYNDLRSQYDALYLAIGAQTDKKTGIPGEDSQGVISAVELLRGIGDDVLPDFTGKKVVVIGGGNVAMDVTRSAIRLGAEKVSCVYRRRQEDMTALAEEVEGALAEGAELLTLQAPVRIEADEQGHAVALWVQPQIIGPVGRDGRPRPTRPMCPRFASLPTWCWWPSARAWRRTTLNRAAYRFAGAASWPRPTAAWTARRASSPAATASPAPPRPSGPLPPARWPRPTSTNTWASTMSSPPTYRFCPRRDSNNLPPHGRVNLAEREAGERKKDFACIECEMSLEEATTEATRCLRCDHFGYGSFKGGRVERW